MKCEECYEEIEGKSIRFRNQTFCLGCAEALREDLDELIADAEIEEDDEEVEEIESVSG